MGVFWGNDLLWGSYQGNGTLPRRRESRRSLTPEGPRLKKDGVLRDRKKGASTKEVSVPPKSRRYVRLPAGSHRGQDGTRLDRAQSGTVRKIARAPEVKDQN